MLDLYSASLPKSIPSLNPATARGEFDKIVASLTPIPSGSGKGIVICGGGMKYFPCAWVCINRLRALGCQLPIELWYLGSSEMNLEMESLLKPLDVRCIDGVKIRAQHPARILNGWESTPFAIIHSSFQEVILRDADTAPVVTPV